MKNFFENSIRFGDADISPGTRLQFIQVPSEQLEESHFVGIDYVHQLTPGLGVCGNIIE